MNDVFQIGNAFNGTTTAMGHARKVWRRIEEQLPGGFRILSALVWPWLMTQREAQMRKTLRCSPGPRLKQPFPAKAQQVLTL